MEVLAEEQEVIESEVPETEVEVVEEAVADTPEQEVEAVEDEVVEVTFGEESLASEDAENDSTVIRTLRKNQREQAKLIKEQKKKLEQLEGPKVPKIGEKPTLEQFDYDAEKFEEALIDYQEKKREVSIHEEEAQRTQKAQEESWQAKLNGYHESKKELKVADFDEAEEVLKDTFDENQQGMLVNYAKNPALLAYAIGKDPVKAERLSKIKDYGQFAYELGQLEKDLKVSKKSKPQPEKRISSSGAAGGSAATTLDKLREEAAKTGEFSKVVAFRKKHNL